MPGKRVQFITREIVPFYYGGIGTQFKALTRLLQRHGHDVFFLSERPRRFDRETFRNHYGNATIFFINPDESLLTLPRPLTYASAVGLAFHQQYSSLKPDIVICADFEAEALMLLLKSHGGEYQGTNFILTINGLTVQVSTSHEDWMIKEVREARQTPYIRMLHAMEKLNILSARTVVAPTALIWNETQDLLGIRKPAWIIPNLADDVFFQEGELRKSSPGKSETNEYLLFIGRLEHRKGADILLEAYLSLLRTGTPHLPKIVFIGGDCYWREYGATFLQHWLPRLRDADRQQIIFAGQVEHQLVPEYLRNAALCIFPSRWETFGIVCLEAMAAGCPVIVSAHTGLEEVIGSSLSAYAVDLSAGPNALGEKILSVLYTRPDDLNDRLRYRARVLMREAEAAWLELISGKRGANAVSEGLSSCWADAAEQLLFSLSQSEPEQAERLKFYFLRNGVYSEKASVDNLFPRYRWINRTMFFPQGTGEQPLRMDPSEGPGLILLKEIFITDEQGGMVWHCNSSNDFSGLSALDNKNISRWKDCFVLRATAEDPQLFLHCPAIGEPVFVTLSFYVGDDIGDTPSVTV